MTQDDPDGAASRAYYAAYHAVSALFAFEKRTFTKHAALASAVHRELVKTGKWPTEVGRAFSWLMGIRGIGDYGGTQHVSVDEAESAVQMATLVLQSVRDVTPESLPDNKG